MPASGAALLVVSEDGDVRTHVLPSTGEVILGRDKQCAVVLDHARVSREHARIVLGPAPTLEDLGSTNGTSFQGIRLEAWTPVPLVLGAAIEIGSLLLIVQRRVGGTNAPDANAPGAGQVRAPAMEGLYRVVERVARGEIAILIQGETGCGKERVAEAIHSTSPRRDGPFLRLNCATLTESLLESELFGHERGAFTGADRAKMGLFESACGGTVFLDEIGELPLLIQAKLLRIIEDRQVLPVGAVCPRSVDVRFVAATNRELDVEVAQNRFRQDLFYRLNGVTLRVPPLRDRCVEIEPLARQFASAAAVALGQAPPHVAPDALEWLQTYEWPGNVRELKNVMERAVLLATDGQIHREHVAMTAAAAPERTSGASIGDSADPDDRERILLALSTCHGNQTRAAKMLGIARSTLVRKLDALGLPRPRK